MSWIHAVPIVAAMFSPLVGADKGSSEVPTRDVVTLTMHFREPVAVTTQAFGPVAESRWDPAFQPHFLYPAVPQQTAGAVFTTPNNLLWLLHDFNPSNGSVQYIIVRGTSLTITLTIRVKPAGVGSDVRMIYDVVALDQAGLAHLNAIREHSSALATEMEQSIRRYLKGSAP